MTTSATPPATPPAPTPDAGPAPRRRRSRTYTVVRITVFLASAFLAYGLVQQLWDHRTPDGHDISHPCALVRPAEVAAAIPGATPVEQPPTPLGDVAGTYYSCRYDTADHPALQIGVTEGAPNKATPKDILGRTLALLHATNIHEINDLPDAAAATYTFTDGSQRLIICKNEEHHLRFGYLIAGDADRARALPQIGALLNASL